MVVGGEAWPCPNFNLILSRPHPLVLGDCGKPLAALTKELCTCRLARPNTFGWTEGWAQGRRAELGPGSEDGSLPALGLEGGLLAGRCCGDAIKPTPGRNKNLAAIPPLWPHKKF